MRRYPEGAIESLPLVPETALQQKWRKAQSDSLLNKRLWKHSEMLFQMEARGVKQWLTLAFGENYIEAIETNVPDIDNLLGNAEKMAAAIKIVAGGKPFPSRTKWMTLPGNSLKLENDYINAKGVYDATLSETPFGVHKPDEEQATRLLVLIANMREHRGIAQQQGKLAGVYSLKSLFSGEVPSPGMLTGLKTTLSGIYPPRESWKVISHPLDYGAVNDNPRLWQTSRLDNQFRASLINQLAHSSIIKGGALYDAFTTTYGSNWHGFNWSTRQSSNISQTADWFALYNHNVCLQTGVVYDRFGGYGKPLDGSRPTAVTKCYSPTLQPELQPPLSNLNKTSPWGDRSLAPIYNDILFISPLVMFYGKAYGRTADPLTFWETHAKYRLRARRAAKTGYNERGASRGSNVTLVDLVEVNPITGAHSGHYVTVMRSSKSPSQAIYEAKRYFPHLLSVEEGNNPRLDERLQKKAADKTWVEAGKRFSSMPESEKGDMVYACVVTSSLEWPDVALADAVVFDKTMKAWEENKPAGDVLSGGESDRLEMMRLFSPRFSKMYEDKKGSPPYDWDKNAHLVASKRRAATGLPFDGNNLMTWNNQRHYTFDGENGHKRGYQFRPWRDGKWDWTRMPTTPFVRRLAFGVPNPFPDARRFSSFKMYLVPKSFEQGMMKLHSDFDKFLLSAGQRNEQRIWLRSDGSEYITSDGTPLHEIIIDKWFKWEAGDRRQLHAFQTAMQLLNSGNWLLFKSWSYPTSSETDLISNRNLDMYGETRLAGDMSHQAYQDGVALLSQYGFSFDRIQQVMSVPINDIADVHSAIRGFTDHFGEIRECIVPDYTPKSIKYRPAGESTVPSKRPDGSYDIEVYLKEERVPSGKTAYMHPYAYQTNTGSPFTMGVTFGRLFGANKMDDIPDEYRGNFGTYMWRRVPINAHGISGKRYTRRTMLDVMGKMFSSEQMSTKTFAQQDLSATLTQWGGMATLGGLVVTSAVLYKYLGKELKPKAPKVR